MRLLEMEFYHTISVLENNNIKTFNIIKSYVKIHTETTRN